MNKNKNNKNNNNYQFKKQRKKNKRKRNPGGMFTTQRYHLSEKPSTYGPGSYIFNATKLVNGPLNTQVTLNGYYDILYENPELERIQGDFKYFRFLGITITFYSRNIISENNQTPCYFLVNYDGLPTENLRLQDNVKIVPAYHIKNKIFKFRIPTLLAGNGILNAWVTKNELNNISQILFQFHAPDNTTSWYFRIDIRMVCRGPTNVTELKEIKVNQQNNIKENENKEMIKKDSQVNERKRKSKSETKTKRVKIDDNKIKEIEKVQKEKQSKDKNNKEDVLGDWDEYDSIDEDEQQGDIPPTTTKH